MPDQAAPGLLRIALVFGDDTAAVHVRDAMHDHADIAYATSAVDFDAARMVGANVTATLVNVDGGDWLDAIQTNLEAAGIAVVYNDPEISCGLDGWERARWLRHLLAKLRGSTDVDPPRPEQIVSSTVDDSSAELEPETPAPIENESAVVERPLSPQEIETMTADFVAKRESITVQVIQAAPQPGVIIVVDEPVVAPAQVVDMDRTDPQMAPPSVTDEVPEPVQAATIATDAPPDMDVEEPKDEVDEIGVEHDGNLDVDTETLSAMIDARLADPESRTPSDSPEVWRVVEGRAGSPVHLDTVSETDSAVTSDASEPAKPPRAEAVAQDDSDVLASLPSLDEWQLVDPEADLVLPPAPAAAPEHEDAEPTFSDDFADLKLVPLEMGSTLERPSDPIERWIDDDESGKLKATADSAAKVRPDGGKE